jgi:hypothetical protein
MYQRFGFLDIQYGPAPRGLTKGGTCIVIRMDEYSSEQDSKHDQAKNFENESPSQHNIREVLT